MKHSQKYSFEPQSAQYTSPLKRLVLPVTNFDFYCGDSTFSHKYKSRLPKDLFIMESAVGGVCRYKLCDNLICQ